MKILIFIFFILNIADAYSEETSSKQSYSKQSLVNFLRPIIGQKINTKNFDIIINTIPKDSISVLEQIALSEENIDELIIPPQQRTFELHLKTKSDEKLILSGKIEWLTNIPILLRPIGPSDTVNLSDIGYQSYPVDQLTAMTVMDSSDLVGKSSAHTIIKPGLPIERSLLKNPTIIKKGDLIDVIYKSQLLTVSAKAQSTQDLACGDTGTFETQHDSSSKQTTKKISAKVIGPGAAEIIHGIA